MLNLVFVGVFIMVFGYLMLIDVIMIGKEMGVD